MSTEEKYELFEAHVDGSLSATEQMEFDALMADSLVKKEFEDYINLHNQFADITNKQTAENEFVQNLKIISTNYVANTTTNESLQEYTAKQETLRSAKQKNKKINIFSVTRNFKLGIAATLLLIIGVVAYNNIATPKQDMQTLFASNYTIDDLSLERGTANDSLENITELYNSKKHAEALPFIKVYSAAHADNGNIKIALATCYFSANDFVNTDATLQALIAQDDTYKQKAEWYLAMSYIKQQKKSEAIALLTSFDTNHFYAEKAKRIVKELQKN